MSKRNRVLLLGWDAADWKIINPLVDQGLMPNMKRLIENGTIANLSSQDPMYSPMLWTSIATGKRAYKHGVLGFSEVTPDGKSVRPVMSVSRKCRAIWNMLTLKNKKSHIVGWWPSHPVEPINGTMISNFFQNHKGPINEPWEMAKGTVHPPEKSAQYAQFRVHPQEITGNHILPFVPQASKLSGKMNKKMSSIAKITAHASSLHGAFTNIIRNEEWDFAALYLDAIDHYCHGFMKYHPPHRSHIPKSEYDLFNEVVVSGYRFHDMMLGRIMQLIDENTTLMLISDHGFQPDHLRPRDIPKEPAGPAYEHNPFGIIACMGPGVKKDHITYGASQLDITPTLLHLMGLPVGKDMDGRVISGLFEENKEVKYIDSWEDIEGEDGRIQNFETEEGDEISKAALKQLEDLGYIEKQQGTSEQRIKNTQSECNFNLARAYIDGGKIKEAIPILEKLHSDNNQITRYAFNLATCYQAIGEFGKTRAVIDHLKNMERFNESTLDMMEGSLLLGEKKYLEAVKLFKKVGKNINQHHSRINYQLASAYMSLKRFEDAEQALLRELAIDPDLPRTHALLGRAYFMQKKFAEAVNSYFKAVGLDFNNPQFHYGLGVALNAQGKYFEAAKALENSLKIYPENQRGRDLLMEIYKLRLNDIELYKKHRAKFYEKEREIIYIVSGLPRSGTSMMMQMLDSGGLEVFTDGTREKDESNPKGYYEFEAVKNIAKSSIFMSNATNKVVKIVAPLLKYIPAKYNYKIVFMERDLNEVVSSQRKMLNRMGKPSQDDVYPTQLLENYKNQIAAIKEWALEKTNVEILMVNHKDVIEDPFLQSININSFFNNLLLPEKMASSVDKKLYREKK